MSWEWGSSRAISNLPPADNTTRRRTLWKRAYETRLSYGVWCWSLWTLFETSRVRLIRGTHNHGGNDWLYVFHLLEKARAATEKPSTVSLPSLTSWAELIGGAEEQTKSQIPPSVSGLFQQHISEQSNRIEPNLRTQTECFFCYNELLKPNRTEPNRI